MMTLLFGTWKGRLLMALVCVISFAGALTCAVAVALVRAPDTAPAACRVPVLGAGAVALAEWHLGKPLIVPPKIDGDVTTLRDLRPMSSEEITQLIQSLKDQRQAFLDKNAELEREQRRIDLYRQELVREREQILALREKVVEQWEEIKKARSGLDRQVTELGGIEARNLKQLATSYESMKPDRAALVVQKLDETTAAKTLFLMRERSAAKIIENLDQEVAARLTERMALLKQMN